MWISLLIRKKHGEVPWDDPSDLRRQSRLSLWTSLSITDKLALYTSFLRSDTWVSLTPPRLLGYHPLHFQRRGHRKLNWHPSQLQPQPKQPTFNIFKSLSTLLIIDRARYAPGSNKREEWLLFHVSSAPSNNNGAGLFGPSIGIISTVRNAGDVEVERLIFKTPCCWLAYTLVFTSSAIHSHQCFFPIEIYFKIHTHILEQLLRFLSKGLWRV